MAIVRLHLTLKKYVQNRETVEVRLADETPLLTILEQMGLPEEEIGLVIRNGKWESRNCIVRMEDELSLFPVLFGG